jgi:hypothetical protein
MKFGSAAALVLGSSLAPAAGAFSYLDSIAPSKGGSSPKYAYSVSGKSFNPVASPTAAAGSSYLDGIADGLMSASHVDGESVYSTRMDNSEDAMLIRSEYNAWLKRYGKTANESRYPTFKANVLALLEYGRQTGKRFLLNEFAEYSAEEFAQMNAAVRTSSSSNGPTSTAVSGSASATCKTSYAPGAGSKPAAPASSGMGSHLNSVAQAGVAAATPQSYAPVAASAAPPVATAASVDSYLSSLSNPATMGSESPVLKKGYTPGQGSKPMAPVSSGIGSTYLSSVAQPPGAAAPPQSDTPAAASSAPVADVTAGASYLSSVSNHAMGSGSPVPKKGYPPGQGSKPTAPAFSGTGTSNLSVLVEQPCANSSSPAPSAPAPLAPAETSRMQFFSKPAMGWAMGAGRQPL